MEQINIDLPKKILVGSQKISTEFPFYKIAIRNKYNFLSQDDKILFPNYWFTYVSKLIPNYGVIVYKNSNQCNVLCQMAN